MVCAAVRDAVSVPALRHAHSGRERAARALRVRTVRHHVAALAPNALSTAARRRSLTRRRVPSRSTML
jgi:hypothetical protein